MAAPHYAQTKGGATGRRAVLARWIVGHPVIVLAVWLLLTPVAVHFALSVTSDNSPDRLIVEGDEDYQQTRAFQKLFPEGQYVVILAEAADPFTAGALKRAEELEQALRAVPKS